MIAMLAGCAPRAKPEPSRADHYHQLADATTKPILYHRTGGIAGTDDRVVIWPDGVVQVSGKLLLPAESRIDGEALNQLRRALKGWDKLNDAYLGTTFPDAYQIKISYGDKTVEAFDLAPDLPEQFRRIFTEIEAIAARAQSAEPQAAP